MTICLCMIVKDEAAIIERCLQSCRGLIDCYVIVDTGSTDGTQKLVRDAAVGIPGQLYERPWVNFGHNRTELLELARGHADYLLLLDADMTVSGSVSPSELTEDVYMVPVMGDPFYRLRALIRGDRAWYSVGATHEYTMTDEPTSEANLDSLQIVHHCDGSRRPRKFQDDRALLIEERIREPNNPRTLFYLANTCRDLGLTEKAISFYLERARMGGWPEEVFYSLYEAGRLAQDINLLFEAWSYRPTRAEPLYELALIFRERRQWPAAMLVTELPRLMPVPDDILFVHRWMYDYGLAFEYSIAAYWAGQREVALEVCDELLELDELPPSYRERVLLNRAFCVPEKEEVHA